MGIVPGDVLACVVARNEAPRLPFFLDYYRMPGRGALSGRTMPDRRDARPASRAAGVTVWRQIWPFSRANFGAGWFEPILRAHGLDT
ncbi:MAG: hypothetical protein KIS91_09060 [Anaerolineae bacterium]|nr:hypothetical protein [Anaerolineae bacterium]